LSPVTVSENGAPGHDPGARSVWPSLPCDVTLLLSSEPVHDPMM
jgi:hypothetical protein